MKKGSITALVAIGVVAIGYFAFFAGGDSESAITTPDELNGQENGENMEANSLPLNHYEFTLNTEDSKIIWEASKIASNFHNGTVLLSEGSLRADHGNITEGSFVIDMSTIADDDGSQKLVDHLKSDDFFDVENYETSTITITNVEWTGGDTYDVTGDLTILDATNEVTFPAVIKYTEDVVTVAAAFEIDRTRWGIEYSSGTVFEDLGDAAIKDEIGFELDLTFDVLEVDEPDDSDHEDEEGEAMEEDGAMEEENDEEDEE